MRVLVTGGRDYQSIDVVFHALDQIHAETPITLIIEGGATGADALARRWAESRGVENITEPADWHTHGKAAGPMRNARMIEQHAPTMVVAFPGGKGTADMVSKARAAGLIVKEIK